MITTHNLRFFLVACAIIVALSARADGEERNEAGTRWVDPVEFYELQDIGYTDISRDYDQGDIDVGKVIAKKGVTVYGLRLKPFCAATFVEKFAHITELDEANPDFHFDFQDLYGVRGVPINEASFCVYADESVNRSYTIGYKWKTHHPQVRGLCEHWEDNTSNSNLNISNLRIVPTAGGIGFAYSYTAKEYVFCNYRNYCHDTENPEDSGSSSKDYSFTKPDGVDESLGHFMYFRGARDLLLMLGCDAMSLAEYMKESEYPMLKRPWPRVYFIVEEILIADEGGPVLDEDTRQDLRETMDGLLAWLSGEGDPLGLGEHTDAKMSAVINSLSTIASLLLANGLVSIMGGGSGSGLVGTLTNGITGAGGTPPPAPDTPKIDALEPKRKEEEDEKEKDKTPPPPPDPNADLFKKYVKTDADGDLTLKDPVTGKETIYTNNGDGTYHNLTTGQDWTPEEIGERLRYETENQALLKQDADQAARNAAEQRAQWDAQNQRDLERGYSDEQKAYADWKQEQENQQKHQEYLEKMAAKYHVPPTDKAVKDAIKFEQVMNEIDAKTHLAEAEAIGESINYLEKVDKGCEVAVNVMSGVVPGGSTVKNVYTFAKSTLVATSEAIAEGKSFDEGLAHIAVGMGDGALGVIQNEAEGLAGKGKYAWAKELGINVATEDLKVGMKAIAEGKSIDEIGKEMLSATGKKTAEFGAGKAVKGLLGGIQKKAASSLDPTDTSKFKFSDGTAKKLNKWLDSDNTVSFGKGTRADVFKVKVNDVGLTDSVGSLGKMGSVTSGQGFSKFYTGAVNTRNLTENLINEGLSQTGVSDYVGGKGSDLMEWANDKTVAGAANVMYGADKTVEFFKNIGKFSDAAAAYKK